MTVTSIEDIVHLKEIGRIVALTIQEMKKQTRVGMTTMELDKIGGRILAKHGAESAPKKELHFPGHTCISVNQDIAHGIPGERVIRAGDMINIDVCAQKNGYVADAGHSFVLAPSNPALTRLCQYTYDTMMKVINSLTHGVRLNEIGRIIQTEASLGGYKVIKNLCSHGVGRAIHEAPNILPVYRKNDPRILKSGDVITIEPFLSTSAEYVVEQPDGWTLRMPDHSFAAQHEHSLIITKNKPIILTAI
ncbi:type I methionyl aminopeptidase [Paenibacillus sp. KN14-4R]|uniref:type I methionyl aminopeptidase n=1 Tax=Paenibacillus sp. KN14-4R TaxID=3445773 RepID=UPI003F9EFBB6